MTLLHHTLPEVQITRLHVHIDCLLKEIALYDEDTWLMPTEREFCKREAQLMLSRAQKLLKQLEDRK
jgi:hypothetical protein